MLALKLVQHMMANGDRMADGLLQKISASDKCSELVLKVPTEERKRYALSIYNNLTDWLADEPDPLLEQHYIDVGMKRGAQGIPFSNLFWAVCIAREHLWEYMQQECLLDEPVEFWGGVNLLHSLNRFFDRILYFSLLGYQRSGGGVEANASAA